VVLGRQLRLIHKDVQVEILEEDDLLESGLASELLADTSFYNCFVRVLKVGKKRNKPYIIIKIKRRLEEAQNG